MSRLTEWIGDSSKEWGSEIVALKEKALKIENEIDYKRADEIFNFLEEYMTLPNNERFKIIPYHKAVLTLTFCIPYDVSEVVVIVGRSNAKSILDVMIALVVMFLLPMPNAVIALMATKKDQAQQILMKHFRAMANTQGTIINLFQNQIKINQDKIKVKDNSFLDSKGTEITVYASNEDSLDGGREQLVIVDEFGAFKKNPLITIRQGLRKNKGLLFISTTNNVIRGGAYDDELKSWKEWVRNEDFTRWVFYYALDDYDEVHKPETYHKANPAIGLTVTLEDIQSDFIGALGNPIKMAKVITKRFNLSMHDTTSIFSKQMVDNCLCDTLDPSGKLVVVGSDFSIRGDVWGTVLVWREEGHYYVKAIPIMPESADDKFRHLGETLTHDTDSNKSDEAWEVFTTQGVKDAVPIALCYDRAHATNFLRRFEETYDIEFYEEVKQNSFHLSNTLENMQLLMQEGRLHFDSQLLGVHLMNAETVINDFGLMRIKKKGYADKIDLADALSDAMYWFIEKEEYAEDFFS